MPIEALYDEAIRRLSTEEAKEVNRNFKSFDDYFNHCIESFGVVFCLVYSVKGPQIVKVLDKAKVKFIEWNNKLPIIEIT